MRVHRVDPSGDEPVEQQRHRRRHRPLRTEPPRGMPPGQRVRRRQQAGQRSTGLEVIDRAEHLDGERPGEPALRGERLEPDGE